GIDVELRASRLAEQVAVQERDGDVAIGAALAHHVLAGILLDRAVLAVLRPRRGHPAKSCEQSGRDDGSLVCLHVIPTQLQEPRRKRPMHRVPFPLNVMAPRVAGSLSWPTKISLPMLSTGAKVGRDLETSCRLMFVAQ